MAARIDYYVSLNSPWTYFGAGRIEALAARHAAALRIYPVDFSAIFAASGGLPLPKRSPQRQAYRMMELRRWRERLGVPIHLQPKFFPAREALPAHAVIAVRESFGDAPAVALAHAILKALWEQERDTGDAATLAEIATGTGLDGGAVLRLAEEPRWAERRAADTQAALERGVFGAPSYVLNEEIFWGQDRLDFLDGALTR
ncbi:2-hydroxychromene-2-carboxylate isomerase [Roseomonas sp. M0104]|uniref:2-hydroxychromene-2-carboxylate isomerase n=1 Tax=Teichococcus coralli TaxID=2545983 RepID=A0A845B8T0_9PROT|nr:2-hydroxychromene-2-carboxylate isomerase [Pseudoroseomonas coralli]MXP63581.1 2-hydroxychromene-2-carboxylate isomerase [Pseudoroseomonas coralli]